MSCKISGRKTVCHQGRIARHIMSCKISGSQDCLSQGPDRKTHYVLQDGWVARLFVTRAGSQDTLCLARWLGRNTVLSPGLYRKTHYVLQDDWVALLCVTRDVRSVVICSSANVTPELVYNHLPTKLSGRCLGRKTVCLQGRMARYIFLQDGWVARLLATRAGSQDTVCFARWLGRKTVCLQGCIAT